MRGKHGLLLVFFCICFQASAFATSPWCDPLPVYHVPVYAVPVYPVLPDPFPTMRQYEWGSPLGLPIGEPHLSDADLNQAIRTATRSAVIRAFNQMKIGNGSSLKAHAQLRESIAGGIEDALVEGFNSIRIQEPLEPVADDPQAHQEEITNPPVAMVEELQPTALGPDGAEELKSPAPGLDGLPDAVAQQLPASLKNSRFWSLYEAAKLERTGWLLHGSKAIPMGGRGPFAVLTLRAMPSSAQIWQSGQLIAEGPYARYFEDTKQLAGEK